MISFAIIYRQILVQAIHAVRVSANQGIEVDLAWTQGSSRSKLALKITIRLSCAFVKARGVDYTEGVPGIESDRATG